MFRIDLEWFYILFTNNLENSLSLGKNLKTEKFFQNSFFLSFDFCFLQGGVILVSHNEQLIQMIAKEVWLVGNKTVKTIDGGFSAYKAALEEEFKRLSNV